MRKLMLATAAAGTLGQRRYRRHLLIVTTGIVVVAGMQRLMQVTHEVQQELQCDEALGSVRGRILQLGRELIDLIHHAIVGDAGKCRSPVQGRLVVARLHQVRGTRDLEIHEVPEVGLVVVGRAVLPIVVGPGGLHVDVLVGGQPGGIRRQ